MTLYPLSRTADPPSVLALAILWSLCLGCLSFAVYETARQQTIKGIKRVEQPVMFWVIITWEFAISLTVGVICVILTRAALP